MRINKNSRIYRGLRSSYYGLWKQNPHIYRLLLPLKLASVKIDANKRAEVKVSPQRIKCVCSTPDLFRNSLHEYSERAITAIQSGDWDLHAIPISDSWIYRCIRRLLQSPQQNAAELDTLGVEIQHNAITLDRVLAEETGGIKGLAEMAAAAVALWKEGKPLHNILVRVGRQGQLLCDAHASSVVALSIAQHSGCAELAGVISVRHKLWQQIRKRFFLLADGAFSEGHGALYQQLWHPDLMDVPHLHKGDDRVKFVEAAAEGQSGAALDIGANLGFFCHRLEDLGFHCHAIENNAVLVDHMRLLRDIEGKTFTATCGNVIGNTMDRICDKEYDLVLALAIFHHFLKREPAYEGLNHLLRKLNMKRMILQTHNPDESQMRGAFRNFAHEAFADHILNMSCLTKRQFMGKTPEGRHVFLLSRS